MQLAALNHYVRDRADRLPGAVGSYSQGAPRAGLNPGEAVRRDIAFGAAVSWQGIRASGDQRGPRPEGYDLAPACSSSTDGLPARTGQPRPGAILAVPDAGNAVGRSRGKETHFGTHLAHSAVHDGRYISIEVLHKAVICPRSSGDRAQDS